MVVGAPSSGRCRKRIKQVKGQRYGENRSVEWLCRKRWSDDERIGGERRLDGGEWRAERGGRLVKALARAGRPEGPRESQTHRGVRPEQVSTMTYMPFTSHLPEHSLVRSHRVFTESVKTRQYA